jgi:hypothetical protein
MYISAGRDSRRGLRLQAAPEDQKKQQRINRVTQNLHS